MPPHIVLLGTCDTKLPELLYLRCRILTHSPSARITLIDVGRTPSSDPAVTIPQSQLLEYQPSSPTRLDADALQNLPRGELLDKISKLATACLLDLLSEDPIHGVVAAGGSGNTSVAAAVMQACPVGLPKLLVSTVASGDVGPIVGESDICLMYSVVDVAGLNSVLRSVLDNAAGAIAGMAAAYKVREEEKAKEEGEKKIQVGITMFGVTTPCVDVARKRLEENGCEVYVFHATGHGGRAMERLVDEGALDAVLDVTTTEICDHLFGGNMSAGPDRLLAAAERGIPYIVSLGACDMVNFGPRDTVPEKFKDRNLLVHNSMVTLMRTSEEECKQVGAWIGERLKESAKVPSMVQVWMPLHGVSVLDVEGAPFHDPKADEALWRSLGRKMEGSEIIADDWPMNINDERFATKIADRLLQLILTHEGSLCS
ncbi:uncharacterized protein BDZ99DRAFT_402654 [Mytilinidion resinicola]|uniref:Uncharacterized protein n=1 Tax=Mytilinidion resinicola TaxID=574789 RepID=A0A6A6XZY1_9PEZI|nr:uncharacterized protein BDZ99DRAFT_402654 [Mytilinidion resinicola]KAF2801823.1 hypothetical protein BDZ99DRAFT_402654 [Mytilinidion resinicola]